MIRALLCSLWVVIHCVQIASAQIITVVDKSTLQPVADALVYNQERTFSKTTDFKGQVDLDSLISGQVIIDHPSFETYFSDMELLRQQRYRVALNQKILLIEEVVISANRWEQEKKQTPNRIVSIGSQDLELGNPQSTADMLAQSGQVFVQKSQLGGGSPMIRGFAANSVLIVVDGVRMNNAIFRSGNLQNVISIDPLTLENTEILFGPGSVMYGSDALGGVMHFRTKSPGFLNQPKTDLGASALLRYSSANNERTGHMDFTLRGNKVVLFTSITHSDYDHLRMGNKRTTKFPDYLKRFQYVQPMAGNRDQVIDNPDYNEQVFSGYSQLNLLNKVRFRLGNFSEISYSINYSTTSDIPRYDRLIETDNSGDFKSAEWYYGPQKWLSNAIGYNIYRKTTLFDGAKLMVALQNIRESRNDRDFNSDWLRSRSDKVSMFTVNLDLEKDLNSKNTFFYGLEWFHNKVDSKAESTNVTTGSSHSIKPRYPEGGSNYSGTALYLSHKWQPSKNVALTTGLRYNRIWLEALFHDPTSGNSAYQDFNTRHGALNGSIGIAWLPDNSWQVNALFSTGFRAPNVDDAGKIFDGANGIVTVPNPELKPEYSYNMEIGLVKSINDQLRISATGFYTILDNALVQDNYYYQGLDSLYFDGEYSRIQALVNSNSSNIYGGSLQLEFALTPELGFSSSFTITKGEDSRGQPLRHTTPNFGFLGLKYQQGQFKGEFNLKYSGKREFEDLPLSEQQKTHLYTADGALSWNTLNISGAYHFSKSISLTLGLENILNVHYIPYSSGISAPGRNFIIGLKGSI